MNSSVTVSVRSLVMTMVVATALVLAYLVGVVQGDAPQATAAAPEVEEIDQSSPTIVMSGSGTATGVPDQLTFKVGVKAVATDVSTALNQASGRLNSTPKTVPIKASRIVSPMRPNEEVSVSLGWGAPTGAVTRKRKVYSPGGTTDSSASARTS